MSLSEMPRLDGTGVMDNRGALKFRRLGVPAGQKVELQIYRMSGICVEIIE